MAAAENDYQTIRDNFTWPRPKRYNFAREVVDRWAERDPSHKALLWVDDTGNVEERTFAQFAESSRRLANVMSEGGVARGDTVILILGRQIAWWDAMTACLRMGAIVSPGTTQLSASDIAYRVNAAKVTVVITEPAVVLRCA